MTTKEFREICEDMLKSEQDKIGRAFLLSLLKQIEEMEKPPNMQEK